MGEEDNISTLVSLPRKIQEFFSKFSQKEKLALLIIFVILFFGSIIVGVALLLVFLVFEQFLKKDPFVSKAA